ncbi:Rne/Rng family ribonuclease [Haloferula sp. A504]|uniref:Rne/Rng family ribonuclease n=1 Tax=Haloferula sp. A504 TaxID=3373601 RepID=UPI0031CB1551|nr:Rne/Rng family ribonuclease [Verrucomicrobiaceae bacterium E54]
MIKRIKRILGIGKPAPKEGTTIIINNEALERRVALLEDGLLEEYTVEREGDDNIVGGIFKGRVKNIEQGLKAMFVDIGMEKNAFLHFWDAIPAALDSSLEEIQRGNRPKKKQKKISSKDIPSIYPVGSEIMIQVSKGPIGTKGPRVTTNISLAGRYLVLMPYTEQFGISRKIDDPQERTRLRKIMQRLSVPEGMGIIMRTVASGTRARHFVRDLAMLLEQWEEVEEKRDSNPAPVAVFREPDLIERTARDFLTDEVDQVICDDEQTTEFVRETAGKISRRAKRRIHHLPTTKPIFEALDLQKQIDEAFSRQVWLKCGGYIVIDETEALIAIDVNTGRNRGSKDVEKMIVQTNIEAAEEVARQLRLRNIGGLVVVDFIDMRHRRDQQQVYKAMKERLKRDKAKTQILQISSIGLMEMTRQRLNESLLDTMYEPCPYCQTRGRVKTTMTMSVEIQRRLTSVIAKMREKGEGDLVVVVSPDVLNRFKTLDSKILVEMERQHSGRLIFRSDPSLHRERFAIIDAATEKTIESA